MPPFPWKKAAGIVSASVAAIVLAIIKLVHRLQPRLLYFPTHLADPRALPSPADFGMPHFRRLWIGAEHGVRNGVRLSGLFMRNGPAWHTRPTLLYLHGNAGHIGDRLPVVRPLYDAAACNVLLVSYRGYGGSTGTPSEAGLVEDALAAVRYFQRESGADPTQLFVMGTSLGGAVAIQAAAAAPAAVRGLIVENTFTSIRDMATLLVQRVAHTSPAVTSALLSVGLRMRWDSRSRIADIPARVPVLFLSGLADELIPPAQMAELFERCPSARKRLLTFVDGDHNGTGACARYAEQIAGWINADKPGGTKKERKAVNREF
jgi:fermentation-respiration switch protein FrsA (DUF1100 family)